MALTGADLREFRNEAEDLLRAGERSLSSLERGDPLALHYTVLFRTFHCLKGAAGILDLAELRSHMNDLEVTLVACKTDVRPSPKTIENLRAGIVTARALIGATVTSEVPTPPADVLVPEGRVLVVDDEPDLVELISHILIASNMEVLGTTEPERVAELIETFRPDAVLTDISMPMVSGMDILNLVRRTYPDLPVVFISGHVDKDSLLAAIDLGVFAVIEKPFDLVRVVEVGRNAVGRHKLLKLLNRSINLVKYHFVDLDEALAAQGKDDVRNAISLELETLVQSRRLLR